MIIIYILAIIGYGSIGYFTASKMKKLNFEGPNSLIYTFGLAAWPITLLMVFFVFLANYKINFSIKKRDS